MNPEQQNYFESDILSATINSVNSNCYSLPLLNPNKNVVKTTKDQYRAVIETYEYHNNRSSDYLIANSLIGYLIFILKKCGPLFE
jgi:hypothetical protein